MHRHIVLIALLFCSANAVSAQESSNPFPPTQKMQSSENGRFVFSYDNHYVLDTKTGRLWLMIRTRIGKPGEETETIVLKPSIYETPDGKWSVDPK